MLDFSDVGGLLPGLRPAAWRGVSFWAIDVEHETGRRIHATLYPGLDLKTHDDVGPLDGHIDVQGLIIGDDYVAKAKALQAACRAPGAATYMDPWLGPKNCVLARPARISFASDELRVARVHLVFDPTGDDAVGGLLGGFLGGIVGGLFSSLSGLLGAVGGIIGAAAGIVGAALSVVPMALAIYAFGVAAVGNVFAIAQAIVGTVSQAAGLLPLAIAGRAAFDLATAIADRKSSASAIAAAVSSYPAQLGAAFRPQPEPGLGPSSEAAPAAVMVPDPRAGAALMFTIAAALAERAQDIGGTPASASLPGRAPVTVTENLIYLAAESAFVAEGVSLMTEIDFDSRQDAQAWQDRADAALFGTASRASTLAGAAPAIVATLWNAVEETRGRIAVDMSEVIGRLPAVERIVPPRASAWLLAQHYAGDDPREVVPMLLDIRRRNRLRHPAVLGAGPIEVLKPEGAA